MSELVPATGSAKPQSMVAPLTEPAGGSVLTRLSAFASQDAVQRALPLFLGLAALGGVALTWNMVAPSPQRVLYSQLDDSERASIAEALDKASIGYQIDNGTGALTVDESDFYRARMLVASDGALAAPQSGTELLDSLPMGVSRTLEGERLRAAREHDLMLTIKEIDGVESVRVHLAEGEKSVFVRDNMPPTASVMLRLAKGRQLSDKQVTAIVNLVAGSVPGLSTEAVRVIDQHGRLLSERSGADSDRLELQSRMEEKLRTQVAQLLTPMFGDGNFTTEIQVELDMNQVTSARESYDKDGAVRTVSEQQSQTSGENQAGGIPGVLSNTPPPQAKAEDGPPQGTQPATPQAQLNGESSSTRTYELGREVSVANTVPGELKRLSVAVALSAKAMKGTKPGDIEQIKQLVSTAVGASPDRGDQVTVVARKFEPVVDEPVAFYETPWFATLVRYGVALLAVLLVLLLGVRPLIKVLKRTTDKPSSVPASLPAADGGQGVLVEAATIDNAGNRALLNEKVELAQRLFAEKPDSAVAALRQMLNQHEAEAAQ
ncbi:MAG: flagellar basal-body MS-ring/collar protein FliF [Novosphingobium sp.]|nr:flagellar M-ring protein FliF [Novosphingobium sp.]MCB2079913.1 flagellar M-ring protein FliF [Novosphingobium sp.]